MQQLSLLLYCGIRNNVVTRWVIYTNC